MDHLYPGLSARERAVLVLEALKADQEPDERIYATMPDDQAEEFNRYVGQIRGVWVNLDLYAALLVKEIEAARTHYLLLNVLCSWALDRQELLGYIAFQTNEPCTQKEFDRHLEEARAEEIALEFAVEAVIEARGLWTDAEREHADEHGRPSRQLARPIEAQVRELVAGGRLVGRGRGAALSVNARSFYDWLGQPAPVPAAWGDRYEVVAEEDVDLRRRWRERIRERARLGPTPPRSAVGASAPSWELQTPASGLSDRDAFVRVVVERLREQLIRLSGALAALEATLAEVSRNFGGPDPAHPTLRATIEQANADLEELRAHAAELLGDVGIAEPDNEELKKLRTLAYERHRMTSRQERRVWP